MQTNDIGMDEFMTLCKLIGTEPYISVNAGFGDSHSAAEEVEYMNGSIHTRIGAERARNGHPEPYHIKYWNIGNEPYGVVAVRPHGFEVLRPQAQRIRKSDAQSGSLDDPPGFRRHARRYGSRLASMRAKFIGNPKAL